ncbi:unnamed protein product [Citrullus colocynthis]|uniref:Uncharacterized protein n=1 Tax=Citrullus colocynthis TaxID=252529 RepID=A0ABP0ZDK8_9ROSI
MADLPFPGKLNSKLLIVLLNLSKIFINPRKSSWPELVGIEAEIAKHIILKENPRVKIIEILLAGSPVTLDLREDRVRIFVNIRNVAVEIPKIG